MKWHIIGSSSYIAKRLLRRFGSCDAVVRYARHPVSDETLLDLSHFTAESFVDLASEDMVVIFAAISSPDECHKNYDASYQINVAGTSALIEAALAGGARVLFLSSDAVIGSTQEAKDESMPVHPIGEYGQMKYVVEQKFASHKNFKAFRLSYVLSKEDKFIRFLQSSAEQNAIPDVYDALYRNVVYLEDVIDAIMQLEKTFDSWDNSIFHLCGPELLSRKNLAEIYQREVDPKLQFTVSVPSPSFFEARPNYIACKSLYLSQLLQRQPHKISDALKLEFQKV